MRQNLPLTEVPNRLPAFDFASCFSTAIFLVHGPHDWARTLVSGVRGIGSDVSEYATPSIIYCYAMELFLNTIPTFTVS